MFKMMVALNRVRPNKNLKNLSCENLIRHFKENILNWPGPAKGEDLSREKKISSDRLSSIFFSFRLQN